MKIKYPIILLLPLIYSISIFAQVIPSDSTVLKAISIDDITISANKTPETLKTIAQQVQAISGKEIAFSQSQTTAELVASTGNIFLQKSQMGGGSPVIRGFEANRILLVVDGVRMNNIIYRGGHLQNIVTTDNAILDRLEILFGPSSTIYGSDALGGVINLYTKNPLFTGDGQKQNLKVNAFSRYGSVNNEFTGHADVNIGGTQLASLTSFTFSSFNDLKGGENQNPFYSTSYGERPYYVERINGADSLVKNRDRYLQVQSAYTQYDILQKFAFKQNEHIIHGLNVQYSNSTDVPRYDRLTDPSGNGLKYAAWYYGPQMRILTAYDLNINNETSTFQKIHAVINYQNVEESRHTRKFGKDNLQHRNEKVNVMGANIDLQRLSGKHNFRFGLDAQYNTLKSTANEENIQSNESKPLDTRYPDGDNNMTNAAIYFSHTWKINKELTLNDGLRFGIIKLHSTFVDTTFFHFPYSSADQSNPVYSGSIGLVHTPTDDLKMSLLLSTGFRAPNVDDLSKVFESARGALIVPNSDLKPEKTINTEIGITKFFNKKASWENNVYYTQFFDAIVTDEFKYNGQDSILYDGTVSKVFANQNKGRAYIFGYSSTAKWQCTDNLLASINMNYTYGRIKTDSSDAPLDHIPPFMMRLQLSYVKNHFRTDFIVNYNGWKKLKDYYLNGEDNEQYATANGMPAWFKIDLRASYQVHPLITLQAGIDNVFDTQYRTFASGINAPGRNVFFALRFNY